MQCNVVEQLSAVQNSVVHNIVVQHRQYSRIYINPNVNLLSLSFSKTTKEKVSDEEELQFTITEEDEDDNVQADGPADNGRDLILTVNMIHLNIVCLKTRQVDLCT